MSLPDSKALLAAARALCERSPADQTEVVVEAEADRFARYADAGPTQCADRERVDVSIRVQLAAPDGFRTAKVCCGAFEGPAAERALERAIALAKVSPVDPGLHGLLGSVDVSPSEPPAATREHGLGDKVDWIQAALAACAPHGLKPAGLARTTSNTKALCTSEGRAVHGGSGTSSFSLTASGATGAGSHEGIASDVTQLDPRAVVEDAVETARRAQDPEAFGPEELPVVLGPQAVSSLLLFASYSGLGAREVHEKRSFLCGRVGEQVFRDCVDISDDVAHPLIGGLPFDGEGTPTRTVPLVQGGVPRGPVTDHHWSGVMGVENTGHARPQPDTEGPAPMHLVLHPGSATLEELIGGIDHGLYVRQFHYTNVIDPKDLMMTGMTRNGTFRIENGKLGAPVKNLRFTDSLVRVLDSVRAIGASPKVAGALFDGHVVAPPLALDRFRFTSATDF